jgi:hypothetical protein
MIEIIKIITSLFQIKFFEFNFKFLKSNAIFLDQFESRTSPLIQIC